MQSVTDENELKLKIIGISFILYFYINIFGNYMFLIGLFKGFKYSIKFCVPMVFCEPLMSMFLLLYRDDDKMCKFMINFYKILKIYWVLVWVAPLIFLKFLLFW